MSFIFLLKKRVGEKGSSSEVNIGQREVGLAFSVLAGGSVKVCSQESAASRFEVGHRLEG